jgi:P27 family predicted phage terminase small subunit
MTTGRRPVPTTVKKLRGNPGKRPFNANEPVFAAADDRFDVVPASITDDPVAAAEWARLAPLLRQAKVVTDADHAALLAACQQWSIYLGALAEAPPGRRVVRSPHDYPIVNPYLTIANKALIQCTRLWDALGLTPAARTRVAAARDQEPGDAFAEFDRVPRIAKGPTLDGQTHATGKPN